MSSFFLPFIYRHSKLSIAAVARRAHKESACRTAWAVAVLRSLELSILLDQLLQPEPWELYRNLRVFTVSFPLVHSALAIFGVPHLLSWAKAPLPFWLLDGHLGQVEFLAARGKELGDIVDGVVAFGRIGGLRLAPGWRLPTRALIFVFVRVVRFRRVFGHCGASLRWTPGSTRPRLITGKAGVLRSAHVFQQFCRDLLEKARRDAR